MASICSNRVLRIGLGGPSGSGTSTVAEAVATKLAVECWSNGNHARKLARERGIEDLNNDTLKVLLGYIPDLDHVIEAAARDFAQNCRHRGVGCVLEGRLPFLAFKGDAESCSILLECSDIDERIKREIDRQKRRHDIILTPADALKRLKQRDTDDNMRYRVYGVDCFDRRHYADTWDTAGHTVDYSAGKVIELASKHLFQLVA